jgi:hypothetical protein
MKMLVNLQPVDYGKSRNILPDKHHLISYYRLFILSLILEVLEYRRGIDWRVDLLTTCIHHSELHFGRSLTHTD